MDVRPRPLMAVVVSMAMVVSMVVGVLMTVIVSMAVVVRMVVGVLMTVIVSVVVIVSGAVVMVRLGRSDEPAFAALGVGDRDRGVIRAAAGRAH